MCVTEVWTYQECGCRFDNDIPCHPSLSSAYCSDKTLYSATLGRLCSVHHSVHRTFLAPICDECLMAELGVARGNNTSHDDRDMHDFRDLNGEDWLLESQVEIKVEEGSQRDEHPSWENENNRSIKLKEPDMTPADVIPQIERNSTASTCDADDEGECLTNTDLEVEFRGRSTRRRGFDIAREHLRIASGWSSGEKKAMASFRDRLQGTIASPSSSSSTERVSVRGTRLAKATLGLQSFRLRRKESKSLLYRKTGENGRSNTYNNGGIPFRARHSEDDIATPRVVGRPKTQWQPVEIEDASHCDVDIAQASQHASASGGTVHTTVQSRTDHAGSSSPASPLPQESSTSFALHPVSVLVRGNLQTTSSWEDHLQQDLGRNSRLSRANCSEQEKVVLTGCKSDVHFDCDNDRLRSDDLRHILTENSKQSIPQTTLQNTSLSGPLDRMLEVLNVPSAEFESDLSDNEASIVEEEDADDTLFEDSVRRPSTSENYVLVDYEAAHGFVTAKDTFGHKHDLSSDSATTFNTALSRSPPCSPSKRSSRPLSLHPLTTPIEVKTPSRPTLPGRSSSLFSPPASSPYRLGIPTHNLETSPTTALDCTKEKVNCPDCKAGNRNCSGKVFSCVCGFSEELNVSTIFAPDKCFAKLEDVIWRSRRRNSGEMCNTCDVNTHLPYDIGEDGSPHRAALEVGESTVKAQEDIEKSMRQAETIARLREVLEESH